MSSVRFSSLTAISLVLSALFVNTASSHHALVAFDSSRAVEIRGVIETVFWRNPHVRLSVRTTDGELWDLEGPPVNRMERDNGVRQEFFPVGAEVVFAGLPSRRDEPRMRPLLARLSSGQVLVMDRDRVVRLALLDDIAERPPAGSEQVEEAIRNAEGIFRVWYANGRTPTRPPDVALPLTDAAREEKASWIQEEDGLAVRCIPAGMPEAMMTPFPMEIVDQGDTIVIRLEEWDNVRTIDMRGDANRQNQVASHLGYSIGRWEGGVLVASTTDIDYPFMDDVGTPLSEVAEIIERFEMSEDEMRLDWSATVIDPETFTEPVTLPIVHFEWRPGVQIRPYDCTLYPGQG